MNTFFTQFKKEAEEIRLTQRERNAIQLRLEDAMREHPLQSNAGVSTPSPYFFFMPRFMAPLAFVLILAVVGGGTAYAAESAVPGDLLYAVKVAVTEPLRGSLAISLEAKASWHAESAVRRMQEAETLTARGTFTSEAAVELEENLDAHVAQVNAITDIIDEKDPVLAASISARLASSLGAHGVVVSRLGSGSEDSTTRKESGDFAERVNTRERTLALADKARSSSRSEGKASDTLAVQTFAQMTAPIAPAAAETSDADLAAAIEIEANASTTLAAAEVKLGTLKEMLAATTMLKIKDQIAEVRAQIERARIKRENGDVSSAKHNATRALRDAATLQAFLEAQGKFHEKILPRVLNVNAEGESTHTPSEEAQNKDARKDEKTDDEEDALPPEVPTTRLQF